MATITYSTAASTSIRPWYGAIASVSATEIVWSDGVTETTFLGKFKLRGSTIIGGTLSEFTQTINGEDYVSVTGLNYSGGALQGFWNTSNYSSFLKAIYAGNDSVTGTDEDDTLSGFGGGKDTLDGGAGNDRIVGGTSNDSILGGDGDDTILGSGGTRDTLDGGDGNDHITAGSAAVVRGGDGDDIFVLTSSVVQIIEEEDEGTDEVQSKVSQVLDDEIEFLTLTGTGHAIGVGNASANTISGNTGNNKLDGAGGDDNVLGNAGADTLTGGAGNDTLVGEAGKDVYLFDSTPNATTNVDLIEDYVETGSQADRIAFDRDIFLGFKTSGNLKATQFWDTSIGALSEDYRIIYDPGTGALSYDRDGDGTLNTSTGVRTNVYQPILIGTVTTDGSTPAALNYQDFFIVK